MSGVHPMVERSFTNFSLQIFDQTARLAVEYSQESVQNDLTERWIQQPAMYFPYGHWNEMKWNGLNIIGEYNMDTPIGQLQYLGTNNTSLA